MHSHGPWGHPTYDGAVTTRPWWQTGTVYQIYPRSFADSDGDGVGDLRGIVDHLDHLAWLGVDAIWLSPIFRSPMRDFGYDVADYCDVDPLFGRLADLDQLLDEAHLRGVRVLLDWVPNHTSDQHPWFVESRSSRTNPRRDWYVWRDPAPDGGPPNGWISEFTGNQPAWTFDPTSGQWYLHCFLPEQPDLNWANPAVEQAMHDVLRFWLDRGVDGFRCDVIHLLGKELDREDPPERPYLPHVIWNDVPATHDLLRRLRRVVDTSPGDPVLVGEVFLLDPHRMATYVGTDQLHLAFNFRAFFTPWDAPAWREQVTLAEQLLSDDEHRWPTWVLSNHDFPRHRVRYGGSEAVARAAAVLLLGLRGTPFLYQGEELGLLDAEVPPERRVDPGGRDGCRAPLPWRAGPGHGWPAEPWLPFPPEAAARSVEAQRADPASILHLYRALLQERRTSPALHAGTLRWLDAPDGVLAFERHHPDGDRRVVVVNMTDVATPVACGPAEVVVASWDPSAGGPFPGVLGPAQAAVLRPTGRAGGQDGTG